MIASLVMYGVTCHLLAMIISSIDWLRDVGIPSVSSWARGQSWHCICLICIHTASCLALTHSPQITGSHGFLVRIVGRHHMRHFRSFAPACARADAQTLREETDFDIIYECVVLHEFATLHPIRHLTLTAPAHVCMPVTTRFHLLTEGTCCAFV